MQEVREQSPEAQAQGEESVKWFFVGSFVELNDTLQITTAQGFPKQLDLEKHRKKPFSADDFKGIIFKFFDKPGARIYHPSPNRCFLVHNIEGKWLYWGKIVMVEQTISGEKKEEQKTSGKFKIIEIYTPDYQELITKNESPKGESYF